MKINKLSGLPLQIYIPNLQTIQPFEFEFYTNPTAPKTTNIVVSYDGTTYIDCAPWEKGVYLYTEKKLPNDGQLLCRATYYIPSPVVPGGLQKIVMDDISTGISIVGQGGSYFDPIADPSKLKTPSFNDPTCSHIPIFMTFYPGAEKGESGKDGAVGMDHSLLTEQIVPGEKWPDRNGDLRQVYVRTIIGRIPTTPWVVDPTLYDVKFGINAWQWNIVTCQFVADNGWTRTPTIECDSNGALSALVKVVDVVANAPYMIILKYTKR